MMHNTMLQFSTDQWNSAHRWMAQFTSWW